MHLQAYAADLLYRISNETATYQKCLSIYRNAIQCSSHLSSLSTLNHLTYTRPIE